MFSRKLAAAAVGLCLTWGSAYAGPGMVEDSQPQAAAPADVPDGVGATNDVIILQLGPSSDGGSAMPSDEETAAMQMLLLQLLMMQSEMGGGDVQVGAPATPGMVGI